MKKQIMIGCLFCAALFMVACKRNVLHGSGAKSTSSLSPGAFTSIEMNTPMRASITVQQGTAPGVQLTGYENVIRHIRATVDNNNTLHLGTDLDETWTIDNKDVTLSITMPSITALNLSGSSDADIHGNITGPSFQLSNSGASTVVIDNINTDDFSAEVSGSCDLYIKGGMVKKATYSISGEGSIKAFALQADETSATISGAGKTEVTALQKLSANVNGAGTIKYKGHPVITKNVSGVGTIVDVN